jgi:glutamyl-tRNA reductase
VSQLWALTAAADHVDSAARQTLAEAMTGWITSHTGSGVALVTCHRAELYGFGPPPDFAEARILSGEGAASHLLRVASGLESVIVGEDEVLHQVRQALRDARRGSSLDRRLSRLFEVAIAAGRRARSRRTESSGNLAQKAVEWLSGKSDFAGRTVLIAGAGRMGSALAHSAQVAGAEIVIASRDAARASRVAGVYGGTGVDLRTGARMAPGAAAVAVALAGPWSDLERAERHELPPIADISAPTAIPDTVRLRLNGSFLGIDDLYRCGGPLPGAYIKDAERLVAVGTAEYVAWLERAA